MWGLGERGVIFDWLMWRVGSRLKDAQERQREEKELAVGQTHNSAQMRHVLEVGKERIWTRF